MARRGKSAQWRRAHAGDIYVRAARARGYRSRAAFKLMQIDDSYRLLAPGMAVADLGAAPGGWSQVIRERAANCTVVMADLLPVEPVAGAAAVCGDFCSAAVAADVAQRLGRAADLIASDMAPNLSGIAAVDQAGARRLAGAVLSFARRHLRPGGALVFKCFEGEEAGRIRRQLARHFAAVDVFYPAAKRAASREMYFVCRGKKTAALA